MQQKTIRFRHPWRGREPGQTDDALDFGVVVELVRRGIAEYVSGDSVPQQNEQPSAKKYPKRR